MQQPSRNPIAEKETPEGRRNNGVKSHAATAATIDGAVSSQRTDESPYAERWVATQPISSRPVPSSTNGAGSGVVEVPAV